MSMLDSFFNKGFKGAKCKTLLKLTIPRIKLLRNRREMQLKQMRRDIAKLLETGQEATARIRVEHIIREENMMAAQEILELFSELIAVRLPIIETQRECPIDLKEAISSVCFAAPRCADLPELLQVQMMFVSKYGKEFVAAATELMPDCGVNRQLIELLSVRAPSPEKKLKLLKEIAEEHELDWDPAATETEFFKPQEDLLNGPTQFVSGSKLPLPKEKHDETLNSAPDEVHHEYLEMLAFPEVPTVAVRPNTNAASATAMAPPMPAASATAIPPPMPAALHPDLDHESSQHSRTAENLSQELPLEPEKVIQERSEAYKDEMPKSPVSASEDRQFLPFISPPSISSASFSARQGNSQSGISTTRSQTNVGLQDVDLQDVLAAAHAAADSAERAAAAARSAASLAQMRISELTQRRHDVVPESGSENPFHINGSDQLATEKPHVSHQNSLNDANGIFSSPDREVKEDQGRSEEVHDFPSFDSFDKPKVDFSSPAPIGDIYEQEPVSHQPQRLPSMEDDPYDSYPNLFTSKNSNLGSGTLSSTDNSRSTHDL